MNIESFGRSNTRAIMEDDLPKDGGSIQTERQRYAELDEPLDDFAHDVCTPLANVKLAGELLINGGKALSEESLNNLGQTLSVEVERLSWMVDVLLASHRLASDRRTLNHDWHLGEELVGNAINRVSEMVDAEAARRVEVNIEPEMAMVRCDGELIELALTALLDLVFDVAPDGKIVAVDLDVDDDRGHFELGLLDASEGPAEQGDDAARSNISEERSNAPGATLALAATRRIIARHGSELVERTSPSSRKALFAFDLFAGDHTPPRLD